MYGVEDLMSTMNVLYATFVMGCLFYLFILMKVMCYYKCTLQKMKIPS